MGWATQLKTVVASLMDAGESRSILGGKRTFFGCGGETAGRAARKAPPLADSELGNAEPKNWWLVLQEGARNSAVQRVAQKKSKAEALQFERVRSVSGFRRQRQSAPRSHPPKTLTAQRGQIVLYPLDYGGTLDQRVRRCHVDFSPEAGFPVLQCTIERQALPPLRSARRGAAAAPCARVPIKP
jgi:hypothetical protein